ncbi:tyrosine-type recombinase/integrase [Labedaea rhizosphaerae]|uniref:Site-specific recombinase XerD n=1 Tax=Labedaea rhizosphaerae TaxID=598644 RepID=A0A4R6SE04_LABRH|nr:site-specific integrase [Labedaea rhizosphaerae]TDP97927.1 site-specific recombinase XerD [Labedaea rhizosphaerae]
MASSRSASRPKGNIEERAGSLRVRVFAGNDPVTNRQVYLRATIPGTSDASWRKAENKLTEFRAQVIKQRTVASTVPFAHAVDEWMKTSEVVDSTRDGYVNYIERYIRPALGKVAVRKIDARTLEGFYAELRRCRKRCDRKPFIEHKTEEEHDCAKAGCKEHVCKPLAKSTVRQIHSIISGTLSAAVRWDWIDSNPAQIARRPRPKPPEPDPPTPAEAAKLAEAAFKLDEDWGVLVWLVMTTGIRRGELCALRFSRIDFDEGVIDLRKNWVNGKEKDTKTHQSRRIALDTETLVLLKEQRERVKARRAKAELDFSDDLFVFSSTQAPDHSKPYPPNAITQRYKDMAAREGVKTHFHALRHYSATELLSAGVDLRTVAGRLGHGGGGATTLRVYAAWVAASDRKAAEILASRMPKRNKTFD